MTTTANQIEITVGKRIRVSGSIMKVYSIENGVCKMLHDNGSFPVRYSQAFKTLAFLQKHATAV